MNQKIVRAQFRLNNIWCIFFGKNGSRTTIDKPIISCHYRSTFKTLKRCFFCFVSTHFEFPSFFVWKSFFFSLSRLLIHEYCENSVLPIMLASTVIARLDFNTQSFRFRIRRQCNLNRRENDFDFFSVEPNRSYMLTHLNFIEY